MKRDCICIAAGSALLALLPAAAMAQSGADNGSPAWLFPGVHYFRSPLADPIAPRFAIALVHTSLFETRGPERPVYDRSPGTDAEIQAAAAIGVTLPVFHIISWPEGGGVVVGAQAAVFARFRIQRPSRDDLGQDWVVGMPIEVAWDESSVRLRFVHRSSHLGDEFAASTGGKRIEFGGESIDLLMAREYGAIRVYGGGGWILHSNTDDTAILRSEQRSDRYTLQAGGDAEWRPFDDPRISLLAGADWQSAQRTNWRSSFAFAAGLRARAGTGEVDLLVRYTDGASALGQFFLTTERAFGLEVVLGL